MKKIVSSIIILCLLFTGCNKDNLSTESGVTPRPTNEIVSNLLTDEKIVLMFCPTGSMSETYVLELYKDGTLTTKVGIRHEEEFSDIKDYDKDNFYLKLEKSLSKTLSDEEFSEINYLIEKMKTEDNSEYENFEEYRTDSWGRVLLTNENAYYFFDINPDSAIAKLTDLLYTYSPMEIDLHGWA